MSEIACCVWCQSVTIDPVSDVCACGGEMGSISLAAPKGTRVVVEEKGQTVGKITVVRPDGRPWIPSGG